MTPEQQAQVRQAVMELNEIRPTEQDHVIREFIHGGGSFSDQNSDGVELDASLARKLRESDSYEVAAHPVVKAPPFQALNDASADAIVRHLERQHPQVVAVVVAHLPPIRAAELVQRLGAKLQSDVLRRVAELDQADPDVIREIEEELEQLLSGEIRAARNRHAGLSTVSAILEAAGNDRLGLLENLTRHDREFANLLGVSATSRTVEAPITSKSMVTERPIRREVALHRPQEKQRIARVHHESNESPKLAADLRTRVSTGDENRTQCESTASASISLIRNKARDESSQRQVPFEDLAQMTDEDWATVVRAIDPQILLLSLMGASEAFVDRIMRQVPARESQELRSRLEQTGPIRLADMDRAQQHVAQRAAELAAQGKIRLPQRSFAAAA
jgi:flagellar motor switch protein FliG